MKELIKFGIKVMEQELMAKHTTLAIGGPVDWYVEVFNLEQLRALIQVVERESLPLFFLGAGSNLLVDDSGIHGVVAHLQGEFEQISFNGNSVRAGAGVFLPTLVKLCAEKGLGGIEPLVGVPGTVGGALVMNAGTRDLEIGTIIQSVELIEKDGSLKILSQDQIKFQYRSSSLNGSILCFATLKLMAGNKDVIIQTVQKFLSYRLKTQPIGTLNVGSVFKNPPRHFAAELIEKAGLKGFKIGNAQVSPKHANFITNCGGASAQNIKDLIHKIQEIVKEKFSIELEPEVKIVGGRL